MHSHCAHCTVTVPKNLHMQICGVWMKAWLEHAECQLQAVDHVFLAVLAMFIVLAPKHYLRPQDCPSPHLADIPICWLIKSGFPRSSRYRYSLRVFFIPAGPFRAQIYLLALWVSGLGMSVPGQTIFKVYATTQVFMSTGCAMSD